MKNYEYHEDLQKKIHHSHLLKMYVLFNMKIYYTL